MRRVATFSLALLALCCLGARSHNPGAGPSPRQAIMPSVVIDDSSGTRNVRVFGCRESDLRVFAQVRRIFPDTTTWTPAYTDSTDTNWTDAEAYASVDIPLEDLADSTGYVYEARVLYSSSDSAIVTPWIPAPIVTVDIPTIRAVAGACTTGGTVNIAGAGFGAARRWSRNDRQAAVRLFYEDFEAGQAGDIGPKFGNSSIWTNCSVVSSAPLYPGGGLYSIRSNMYNGRNDPITAKPGLAGNQYPFRPLWGSGAAGDTLWVRYWLRYDQSDWTRGQATCCGKDQYFVGSRDQGGVADAYYNDRIYADEGTNQNKFSENHSQDINSSYVPTLTAWRADGAAGEMNSYGTGSAYFRLNDGDSTSIAPPYQHADGVWHRWDFVFDYASALHTAQIYRDGVNQVAYGNSAASPWASTDGKIPIHPQWLCVGARFPFLQTSNYPASADSIDSGFAGYQIDNYEVWVGRPGDSTVRLGNASTYRACTYLVNQPVVSWGDTGISLSFNAAGFPVGATAWLYITDGNGYVMSNGAPVVIGYRLAKPVGEGSYSIGARAEE